MIKTSCFIWLILFVFLILSGCRMYSMVVLENPEFPDDMLPTDLNNSLLDKYSVGDVVVHPRIHYEDSAQTKFKILVVFFSKINTQKVAITELKISVNDKKIEYGKQIINTFISDWKTYPANKPYYVCSISGEPINRLKKEMINSRVNTSLEVTVKDKAGSVLRKKIDVYFLSKKRSFIE